MMFLVLFASLATTMAVVTQGNLRSATSHMRVTKSLSGVDTGMEIAFARLEEATGRFLVARGEITPEYASELWLGTFSTPPAVQVLGPRRGRVETGVPGGLREALEFHHGSDAADNVVAWGSPTNVPAPIPEPEEPTGWLVTNPIGLERNGDGEIVTATQITYGPPDANGRVIVSVTGYNWDFIRERWVSRTAQQSLRIAKRIDHAILSPSRVMLGRNVQVNGPLGVSYDSAALNTVDGSPLYVKSDFYGLDAQLNAKLDDLFDAILAADVDGDNRLRVNHLRERAPLVAMNATDYDGDGTPDSAFDDATYDGAVDEFDVFMNHFDTNRDGRIVLSAELTAGTPAEGSTPEFVLDDALAMLIDGGYPDRNGNGQVNGLLVNGSWDYDTFDDNNEDGLIDSRDLDADDVVLGYRDGFLDYKDRYAKIRGTVYFRVSRQQWEEMTDDFGVELGDFQREMMGTIAPSRDEIPIIFEATEDELPNLTPDSFQTATTALRDIALNNTDTFEDQVGTAMGAGWTPPTTLEYTPYGAPAPSDWYERPVYTGITFENVVIPMGTNALFVDCTFIGVTLVETYLDNTHPSWRFYGQQSRDAQTGTLEDDFPIGGDVALDKSWVDPSWEGYDELPDPLMVDVDLNEDGVWPDRCTDTKRVANNIRFHDCLFVGSVVSERAAEFRNRRNKIQFTGSTRFTTVHPDFPDDPRFNPSASELEEIRKSSLMLPNYSVDIGTNNSPEDQDVELNGAIVAGVLDVRGNATINGVVMADFTPRYGLPPFELYGDPIGDPANFNITLGYLGPVDGDSEGIDLSALSDLDGDGDLDIGWDSARDPSTGELIDADTVSSDPNDWPDEWFDELVDDDAGFVPGNWVRRAITFNGFGRITINWNPDLPLPDGLLTPVGVTIERDTYEEGRLVFGGG